MSKSEFKGNSQTEVKKDNSKSEVLMGEYNLEFKGFFEFVK
jgi:hypothetical protein